MLRKHLGDKVQGVFYGSTIELPDPYTGAMEKKPLKPFLVNQTALMLERGQLRIPHKDTSETIHRQMTDFRVVKVSERTKQPTYNDTDEHGLDAMIFALYAFMNEYPELVDIVHKREVARRAGHLKTRQTDPLQQALKERIQQKDDSTTNELTSHPKRTKARGVRKPSAQTSSLGWGRRGLSSNKRSMPKRRGF